MSTPLDYLRLMRPLQWVKNSFLFAGLLFAHQWQQPSLVMEVLFLFAAFCLLSSSVYCINDVIDVDKDKRNPEKCRRPVASGSVSPLAALGLGSLLCLGALAAGFALGTRALAILVAYLALNVAYSFRLKHMVLLDVFCLAMGFVLRILGGTWAVGIPPSQWLLLCTISLSLFLGFTKRYAELKTHDTSLAEKRSVLAHYSTDFLHILLGTSLSATITTYGLYTISGRVLVVHEADWLIHTLPLVIFGLLRYLYLVMQMGVGENTVKAIVRDPQLVAVIVVYVGLILMFLR